MSKKEGLKVWGLSFKTAHNKAKPAILTDWMSVRAQLCVFEIIRAVRYKTQRGRVMIQSDAVTKFSGKAGSVSGFRRCGNQRDA